MLLQDMGIFNFQVHATDNDPRVEFDSNSVPFFFLKEKGLVHIDWPMAFLENSMREPKWLLIMWKMGPT